MGYLAKVAVITRTKNRALLLERALNSVLNQTYEDWFLVVVNDGGEREPVDHLIAKYADRFAGRVAVLHNQCSRGMEAASNQGIAYGESEYLVIHDDDDSWAPQFLMMCVNELEQAHKAIPTVRGIVSHSVRVTERIERGTVVIENIEPYNNWIPKGVLSLFRMAEGNTFPPISFLFRRDALETVGHYCPELPVLGDWDFNLRFMSHYDILVVPFGLAFYHHRVASTTSGTMANSVYGASDKHMLYEQYLRNEMLRRDMRGETSGLGMLLNEAQRLGQIVGRLDAMTDPLTVSAETATIRGKQWQGIMYLASLATFLRSPNRRGLVTKFVDHWRNESPRRAIEVVARFGYLAMGGK